MFSPPYFTPQYWPGQFFYPGGVSAEAPQLPVADFIASTAGGIGPLVVSFTNLSAHATVYRWYFTNGPTADSTMENPVVMLYPGVYDVRLEIEGPGGSDSILKSAYIEVLAPPPGVGKSRHAFLEAMKGFGDLELGPAYAGLKKILIVQKKSLTVRKTK